MDTVWHLRGRRSEAATDALREVQRAAADALREVERAAADVLLAAQREAAAILLKARMRIMDARESAKPSHS